jgi:hypothetical protein
MTYCKSSPLDSSTPGGGRLSRAARAVLPLCGLLLVAGPAARADAVRVDAFRPLSAHYPRVCQAAITGMSGLCLLASRQPQVRNTLLIRPVPTNGQVAGQAQPATFNRFMPLQPGQYLLYAASGMDSLHELPFTVAQGQLTTVKTGTVKFAAAGKAHRLQHYQSQSGINGRGCAAEIISSGARAVLPGNYQVNLVNKKDADGSPRCLNSGVTFNVLAGETVSGSPRQLRDQSLPKANTYSHPNGKSALASMSYFTADLEKLAVLPHWKSFSGIHNPHGRAYSALVLSGIGTQHFLVPFTVRLHRRECGLSLSKAGLQSHVLLTNCRFKGGRLTAFRVQPGSFYTLNNRHGKTAIEGNFINNPIVVDNVRFALN